jgi:hypothetical protein
MIVEQDGTLLDWEKEMIRQGKPRNIIAGESVTKDGAMQIWYEITGKQSLDVILETGGMRYDLFTNVVMALYDTASSLEGLLLDTNGILLSTETIFVDGSHDKIFFCYYPTDKAQPDAFEKLMESLLPHIDHTDERCVSCAYAVYEQACKEGFGLSLLKNIMHLAYEKEYESYDEPTETVTSEKIFEEETTAHTLFGTTIGTQIGTPFAGGEKNRKRFDISKLQKQFTFPIRHQKSEEPFVFEPDEEETEGKHPTVLLTDIDRKPEGLLFYEGNGAGNNIRIDNDNIIIGSDERLSGYIPSVTVSRNHARISKEGDTYWIEDLNSVNGTYLDGNLLNYRDKTKLNKNQLIRFADEKYRFI